MDVAKIGKIDLFSQIIFHELWHLWFTYLPGQMEVGKLVFTADPGGLPYKIYKLYINSYLFIASGKGSSDNAALLTSNFDICPAGRRKWKLACINSSYILAAGWYYFLASTFEYFNNKNKKNGIMLNPGHSVPSWNFRPQ